MGQILLSILEFEQVVILGYVHGVHACYGMGSFLWLFTVQVRVYHPSISLFAIRPAVYLSVRPSIHLLNKEVMTDILLTSRNTEINKTLYLFACERLELWGKREIAATKHSERHRYYSRLCVGPVGPGRGWAVGGASESR